MNAATEREEGRSGKEEGKEIPLSRLLKIRRARRGEKARESISFLPLCTSWLCSQELPGAVAEGIELMLENCIRDGSIGVGTAAVMHFRLHSIT